LLGLGLGRSPVGLALRGEFAGARLFETGGFPLSKTGAIQLQSDETHTAGFRIIDLKSNRDAFFSALDRPGAKRQMNPTRARMATALLKGFLCIGASYIGLGTPCRKVERQKPDSRKPNHSHPRRNINLDDCKLKVKGFFSKSPRSPAEKLGWLPEPTA
jgi:hypothetical protein